MPLQYTCCINVELSEKVQAVVAHMAQTMNVSEETVLRRAIKLNYDVSLQTSYAGGKIIAHLGNKQPPPVYQNGTEKKYLLLITGKEKRQLSELSYCTDRNPGEALADSIQRLFTFTQAHLNGTVLMSQTSAGTHLIQMEKYFSGETTIS